MFKISVKDPQCRHVLLGACHDAKYLTALQMHSLFDDKVTCIKSTLVDTGIKETRIKNVGFPQVFRADIQKHSGVSIPNGIPAKIPESGACWVFHKVSITIDCRVSEQVPNATRRMVASARTADTSTS